MGYNRHNLKSVERYVIHRNLGYCIVFYLFRDSRRIIILVLLLLLLLYDIMSNIVILCRKLYYVLTMGFVPEINYLVSCILYLVSCNSEENSLLLQNMIHVLVYVYKHSII